MASRLSTFARREENSVVCDPVLLRVPQDLTKFHLMESFNFSDVSSIEYPVSQVYRRVEITTAR